MEGGGPASGPHYWGRGRSRGFRGPHHGHNRAVFRGPGRGGPSRGRGATQAWSRGNSFGGQAALSGSNSNSLSPTYHFVKEASLVPPHTMSSERTCSISVRNLPPMCLQDCQRLTSFIVGRSSCPVEEVYFINSCDKSGSLSAVYVLETGDKSNTLDNIHRQVFLDHHLLAEKFLGFQYLSEYCIKVSNLSTNITEEKLFNLFESCGHISMIYLNREKPDQLMEALINFGDTKSVVNASKFDGVKLDGNKIKTQKLDQSLCVYMNHLDTSVSLLKNLNVVHIENAGSASKWAYVFFSDRESYLKALEVNEKQDSNRKKVSVTPIYRLYVSYPGSRLPANVTTNLRSFKSLPHPSKHGIAVMLFKSKEQFENVLQTSPILINNESYKLYDSISKVSHSCKSEEDSEEEEVEEEEVEVIEEEVELDENEEVEEEEVEVWVEEEEVEVEEEEEEDVVVLKSNAGSKRTISGEKKTI